MIVILEFIMLPTFDKGWKELGLNDNNLRKLQNELISEPKQGDLIVGSGGLRKIRIPTSNTGKSGGARVSYVYFDDEFRIYLISVFGKSQKENFTKSEILQIKSMIIKLKKL